MKKLFIAALIATTIATSAFASDANKLNVRIAENFKFDYQNATNVNWTLRPDFTKATFELDGQKMEAFYNYEGKVIGTSTHLSIDALPVSAKRSFAKRYAGYTIHETIYFEGPDASAYFISAENEKELVIVKVDEDSYMSVFQQTRKK